MKRLLAIFSVVGVILLLFGVQFIGVKAEGQNGTTLEADVTTFAHSTITYNWTIRKSVTPNTFNMFTGDSATAQYTVILEKDAGTLAGWLDGQVCVKNGGAVATENLAIAANVTMPPGSTVIASTTVDVSAHPVIAAGETYCYAYNVKVPNPETGATYKITTDITITNHSGHLGTPFGPRPSETTVMPAPTLINDSVNVVDTNGGTWTFSASGSQSYPKTFTCDTDKGLNVNTVTISETGQTANASVTVNCYSLQVTKTSETSFIRTYKWAISKTADQSSLTLALGQSFLVNYAVTVGLDTITPFVDRDFAVAGHIYVKNPAPINGMINSVSDVVSGIGAVPLDCGVTFPYTLAAGSTLTCTYIASLPDTTSRTNTATATLQNTPTGTTNFTGTVAVDFSNSTMHEVDKCANVTDNIGGTLGQVCVGILPITFQYTYTVGPYATCGTYKVSNIATFVAIDTLSTGSASWQVTVDVPCPFGCTLTIGYWKTHAGFNGNNPDMVTPLLPVWLGTAGGTKSVEITTAEQAVMLLSMSGNASNGINKLYAQLLGARLNIASGASDTAISSTMVAADAYLATHNAADWRDLTKAEKAKILGWATALDNFNNGLTGPGHCSY